MYGRFDLFGEEDASQILSQQHARIKQTVDSEQDDYILNVNETDYVAHVVGRLAIEPLVLHFDAIEASSYEAMIPASRHPNSFFMEHGESYKRDVIRYHIPFSGPAVQLRWRPSRRYLTSWPVDIEGNAVCYDIIDFGNEAEQIRRDWEQLRKEVMEQYGWLMAEIKAFNDRLESEVRHFVTVRRQHLAKKGHLLSQLGVPIRKRAGVPSTFSIPAPSRRKPIEIKKPSVAPDAGKPEPTLDETTYHAILKIIQDVGKQFERMPSIYAGKEEEHLRDHILLVLEPNFEGSATGETFNKAGKTDILLRHEGKNVFVGECKFWRGEKAYLDTLTQLLGYLTWRDSKSAVILFVPNKDFTAVLATAKAATPKHPNYVSGVSAADETCLHYMFHLNGDPQRHMRLAVMLFHIPGA